MLHKDIVITCFGNVLFLLVKCNLLLVKPVARWTTLVIAALKLALTNKSSLS